MILASTLYRLLCGVIGLLARLGGTYQRDLEVAVLRHQLKILARRGSTRPRYTVTRPCVPGSGEPEGCIYSDHSADLRTCIGLHLRELTLRRGCGPTPSGLS